MSVAKNVVFKLGTAGSPSVLTDISAKLSSAKLSRDADALDSTTFGTSGAKSNQAGLTGGTISIEGNWDATINAHLANLLGVDDVSFERGPEGGGTGTVKETGKCVLTKYEPPSQVGQVNKFTAEFTLSGAVTVATY